MKPPALQHALSAFRAGRYAAAEQACRSLLADPATSGDAYYLLGRIANKTGRHAESVQWLEQAAARLPPSLRLFSALAGAYQAAGNLPRAAECFSRCLELDPHCVPAAHKLADVRYQAREFELAVEAYRVAAALAPDRPLIWNNLGKNLRNLGRVDEAVSAYQRALALAPDDPVIHTNFGTALLTGGRLKEGFREYALYRRSGARRAGRQSIWRGEPLPGKTLLIYAEQGLGDTIQFVRYLKLVRERVARIVLECQPPLRALLQQSGCADLLISSGDAPPPFDAGAALLDLPAIFETTLDTVPAKIPYLFASRKVPLPQTPAGRFKVGLAWAGNPHFPDDATRSMPVNELAPLLKIPGVSFFNLQKNFRPGDETFLRSAAILNPMDSVQDFADTAAVVAQLDLIVTVDTAVAHLAGALGKPVWLLLPRAADWRWLLDRTDTPWYPTVRLFRQNTLGNWQPVIAEVGAGLKQLV
jgi:Tfp pilus assembly protein PilF